jgi:secreted trypsin-like serine protease
MSKIFALITLALIASVAANTIPEKFVKGGEPVVAFETPFIVTIQRYVRPNWVHFCNGALIRENWVLTAAACIEPNILVVTGKFDLSYYEPGQQRKTVAETILSPDGKMALIRLDTKIVVDSRTSNITLPINPSVPGNTILMKGWPVENDNNQILLQSEFNIMDFDECSAKINRVVDRPREFCVNNIDSSNNGQIGTCFGNLGSPVVHQRCHLILVGIVTTTQNPCNDPSLPVAVVSNLANYREWVMQTAGDGVWCPCVP